MPAMKYLSPDLPRRSVENSDAILQGAIGAGPLVGGLGDHPIYAQVIDRSGRTYSYVGLAPRCRDGSVDVDALRAGEFVVPPGLLYLCEDVDPKSRSKGI